MKKNAVIVHDYIKSFDNTEADALDNLSQANLVHRSLTNLGYNTLTLQFDGNLSNIKTVLEKNRPTFVFNLVEDEAYISIAPLFFESINLPYTGCRADSIYHTHNKLIFKRFLKSTSYQKNILTPRYVTAKDLSNFVPGKKYILKPADRHSSISIDKNSVKYFQNAKDIKKEIFDRQKKYNFDFYAEEYIEGREFNISLLNGKILPRAEIIFKDYKEDAPKIVCYKSKWDESSFEYKNTVRSFERKAEDQKLFDDMDDAIIFLSRILNIETYARFDFRTDKNNNCYLLEINTNPCLGDDGGFYAAANRGGLSYDEMISVIIKSSLKSYL